MIVSAPASSANLGPGFDCLGLAVDLAFLVGPHGPATTDFLVAEQTHPVSVAYLAAGGDPGVALRWSSPIPPGRGLGFSGAARVAGAYLAARAGHGHDESCWIALRVASELEGHPDNAAASALGGFTVAAGDEATRLEVPAGVRVLVWWPQRSTSTDAARKILPPSVSLEDAAFSIGRASLWVAALATGDLDLLRTASQDRLHQPHRLAAQPDSATVLDYLLAHDRVHAAWLSGSGPTVAALVSDHVEVADIERSIPVEGHVRLLDPACRGVHVVG